MVTIYDLKPKFQALLRPLVNRLARAGVTPNQVTWSAVAISVVGGLLIGVFNTAAWPLVLMPLLLFLRMALNAIDGMLAKEHAMKSDAGAILNEMGDVVSDAALYLPLACVPGISGGLVVAFVILGVFTEMAGVLAATVSHERRYDGPMGKSDRAFVVGCAALLLGAGVPAGFWLDALLAVASLLALWTVVRRCRGALS